MGECYYRIQRFDEAIFEFKKTSELRPDFSTAYFNLGNTVYKRGALQEIVSAYLEILETRYTTNGEGSSNSPIAEGLKELKNRDAGKSQEIYDTMIRSYREALKYEPGFYEASFNLALTYENLNQPDSAELFYKKSLKSNSNLVRAHMRLGRLYEKQGHYQKALEHFKEVVAIEPSYFSATPRLGENYRYINILEEVLKEYQLKHDLSPNRPEIIIVLARIFSSLGRLGQAEKLYAEVVQLDPQNREATRALRDIRKQLRKM
jgi:tetratricopeptide (TPR) repeat protein